MGAETFYTVEKGKNAREAFTRAVEEAQWNHGHGGYSGSIAEKREYTEFTRPKGMREKTVRTLMHDLMDFHFGDDKKKNRIAKKYPKFPTYTLTNMAKTFDDKWGPAVCMEVKPNTYYFCGWASS
jgi:hypothetical protein